MSYLKVLLALSLLSSPVLADLQSSKSPSSSSFSLHAKKHASKKKHGAKKKHAKASKKKRKLAKVKHKKKHAAAKKKRGKNLSSRHGSAKKVSFR